MATDNPDKRIYQQIEASAGFYEPAVYELLTFYHALQNQPEPLDGQFIPLTDVQFRSSKDTKIFAVGLIPPSSNVTGRLLDRSTTIRATLGASTATAQQIAAAGAEEVIGNAVNDPLLNVSTGPDKSIVEPTRRVLERSDALIAGLDPSVQPLAKQLIRDAAKDGVSLVVVQGFRSIEYQNKLYAQGRDNNKSVVTGVKGGDSWHNYGLAFDVAMVSSGPKPPAGSPAWPPNKDVWTTIGALGQNTGMTWGGSFSNIDDQGHFEYHPGITKAQAKAGVRPSVATNPQPIVDSANSNPGWVAFGADNANQANRTASKLAGKDLNRTGLGQAFLAQQLATIKAMQDAIRQMANTPPLRLLVNPQSFRVSAEKIISDGNWGRNGPIIEHWGEAQDKIEGSGKVAAFYSMDIGDANGPGLTRTARQFSQSYQNLLALWLIYKNNGGVWFPDPIVPTGSKAKNLAVVGSVYLYYDEILYVGSFDNFSLTESETAPFTLEYSFSFTVRAWYLLDHLDDAQYTYGQPNVPSLPTGTGDSPFVGGDNPQPAGGVALPPGQR